jgi:hypothetical protein
MVAPSQPAFVRLSDGRVLGNPTPATAAEAVRINPLPAQLPPEVRQKRIIVRLKTPPGSTSGAASGAASGTSRTDTPGTSTAGTREGDRKKSSNRTAEPGADN